MKTINTLNHTPPSNLSGSTHLEFKRIQQYVNGQLETIETQLAGHHIMHCPRCEAIWEQLIRSSAPKRKEKFNISRLLALILL